MKHDETKGARDFMALLYSRQVPSISNRYLKMLDVFCNGCITQEWLTENPFLPVKPIKDSGPKSRDRPPFTLTEIKSILTAFQNHPRHHAYHDFVLTRLTLGLRPSEAIDLRWKHVDLPAHTVLIAESLSRSREGSQRIQKGRKNGVTTVLTLPDSLHTVLQSRYLSRSKPEDLIFTSVTGRPIDDHTFSQRTWRDVLKLARVPHRPPYNCRHTMASHALNQGLNLTEVAYLMGHRDTNMVSRTYGHIIDRPNLPKLDL